MTNYENSDYDHIIKMKLYKRTSGVLGTAYQEGINAGGHSFET